MAPSLAVVEGGRFEMDRCHPNPRPGGHRSARGRGPGYVAARWRVSRRLCATLQFQCHWGRELAELRSRARQLADVLGVVVAAPTGDEAAWYFADPAHEDFGEIVGPELLLGGRAFVRGSWALIQEDPHDNDSWTVAQRVLPKDKPEWLGEKRSGAGRDPRLNEGPQRIGGARVLLSVVFATLIMINIFSRCI